MWWTLVCDKLRFKSSRSLGRVLRCGGEMEEGRLFGWIAPASVAAREVMVLLGITIGGVLPGRIFLAEGGREVRSGVFFRSKWMERGFASGVDWPDG